MIKLLPILFAVTFFAGNVCAQSVLVRVAPDEKSIQVKWLHPKLTLPGGFNVYRRTAGKPWERLNETPVRCGVSAQNSPYLNGKPELKKIGRLAESGKPLTGIPLMVCVLKSFEDPGFSRFLGILFDDDNVVKGKTYEYKITTLADGKENDLDVSTPVKFSDYKKISPPADIVYSENRRAVRITWIKETTRYYAVNVYRRRSDSTAFVRLNAAPLVASGDSARSQFTDDQVKEKSTYVYYLEGIDFFGSPSKPSSLFFVSIPDRTAPACVDSVRAKADGRKIGLRWHCKPHSDVAGFLIYRTNRNDTDFTPITRKPLPNHVQSFSDVVSRNGSFSYRIVSVDGAGNQSIAPPVIVDAFDNLSPDRPQLLKIAADSGRIILQWKPVHATDLAGYHIYRAISADGPFLKITSDPHTANSFTDNIPPRTRSHFHYYVTAIDSSLNNSVPSEILKTRLPDTEAPTAPFLQRAVATESAVLLYWFPNPEIDLKGYEVFRRQAGTTSQAEKVSDRLIPPRLKVFIDRTAAVGTDYEYSLTAIDSAGLVSRASNIIVAHKKRQQDKSDVINLTVHYNEKSRHAEILWESTEPPAKGFVVYKSNGGPFLPLTGFIKGQRFTDKQINTDMTTVYQVRAYSANGAVTVSRTVPFNIQKDYQP